MKISARNHIKGEVTKIDDGAVNGVVHIGAGGGEITAVITMNAISDLDLKPGKKACAIIKASDVIIATDCNIKISARNVIPGKVKKIQDGAVNGIVTLNTKLGDITASITMNAISDLGLKEGGDACAVIKASHVIVGVE